MPDNLKHISAREDRGVLILTVELARISSYEQAETIGRELLAAVEGRQSAKVVVDLSKLTYMSSVGYGPLITLRSRVRADGGRLVLCGLSGVVKEVFEATRLLINPNSPKSLFEFTDTADQAVALLTEGK
jgi:anti-anti-sigma factor